jgi:hypothetical protein
VWRVGHYQIETLIVGHGGYPIQTVKSGVITAVIGSHCFSHTGSAGRMAIHQHQIPTDLMSQ